MTPRLSVLAGLLMTLAGHGAVPADGGPVAPTILLLSRAAAPSRTADADPPTLPQAQAIIAAARKILRQEPKYLPESHEHIVILDEGDCWLVTFHARGKSHVKLASTAANSGASSSVLLNTNAGVYLHKRDLTRARRGPRNPVRSLPVLSPPDDIVQGPGLVVLPLEPAP
jgi:hypothetical protein